MSENSLVSIIIPIYNKENQLCRCIDSLLAQSFTNFELILVDDGSTDNSYEVAKKYTIDSRVRVLRKKNGGVSSARNMGLNFAKGDFVCFVDSDDWVEPSYILDMFTLDRYPVNSLVIQSFISIGKERTTFAHFPDKRFYRESFTELFPKYDILSNGYPFGKLYERRILNENNIRFNESLSTHEDHVFVLSYMLCVDNIILSSKANYMYMLDENPHSLSKKLHSPEMFLMASDLLLDKLNHLNELYDYSKGYHHRVTTDYGLTQRIRAILSSYVKGYSRTYRLDLLRSEFRAKRSLYSNYKSKRLIQDFAVSIIKYVPIPLLDFLMDSIVICLGMKGRDVHLVIKK